MYLPIRLIFWLALHWPACLHWPFCPGVFIALLGLLAAVVTFWDSPPRFVKVITIALFTVLMLCEIWMMSKDRDKHDHDEQVARSADEQRLREMRFQSDRLNLLNLQFGQANQELLELSRESQAARGDVAKTIQLQSRTEQARKALADSAKQYAITLEPSVARNIRDETDRYYQHVTLLNDGYYHALSMPDDEPRKIPTVRAYEEQKAKDEKEYQDKMLTMLNLAYPLKQQLLLGSEMTETDKAMDAAFTDAMARNFSSFHGKDVAYYLDELAKRASQ